MKIYILFNSSYPSIGAASKRVNNYEKGLRKLNVDVRVLPFPQKPNNFFLSFLQPATNILRLFKIKGKPDIYFVYGFGWFTKLIFVLCTKINRRNIVLEVNEKPYSII